jgi:hypothetical protein
MSSVEIGLTIRRAIAVRRTTVDTRRAGDASCPGNAEQALLLADAHDPEVDARNLDRLVQWIDVAEEAIGEAPAEERHWLAAVHLDRAHHPSSFDAEGGEVEVRARDALDLCVIHLDGPVRDCGVAAGLCGD